MLPTCAGATGGAALRAAAARQLVLSPRLWALVEYLLALDPALRHTLVLECRGTDPWAIERHVARERIELRP